MRIAITGGSGTLGRALIARLAADGADKIVTFSRDEQKRASLASEFGWHPGVKVYAGDVRDRDRLLQIFGGCEAVIHAAARKVVTAHPDEPEEMLKTNVLGTQNVIAAASAAGCSKVMVVSSDKAVRAENAYGVAKAMAEHLAVNANARTLPRCRVGVVRYGNVIGSTGSVLTVWRRLAERGEPLPLSHPEMTRFWITVPQAVEQVLTALANLRGGEIHVPRLPAAPVDMLAAAVWNEYGPPDGQRLFKITGIRQGGEKLHEELLSESECRRVVRKNGHYVVPPFQHAEMWDDRPWLGERVPDDFAYRSDTWEWQLSPMELRDLVTGRKEVLA